AGDTAPERPGNLARRQPFGPKTLQLLDPILCPVQQLIHGSLLPPVVARYRIGEFQTHKACHSAPRPCPQNHESYRRRPARNARAGFDREKKPRQSGKSPGQHAKPHGPFACPSPQAQPITRRPGVDLPTTENRVESKVFPSLLPTYNRADVAFVRGEGPYLFAEGGERYLD